MGTEKREWTGVDGRKILAKLDKICKNKTPSKSIADVITFWIEEAYGGSQSDFANHSGLHRNFVIDVMNGRYPKVLKGSRLATHDPRYTSLAKAIGLADEEDIIAFTQLVSEYQKKTSRKSVRNIGRAGPEIDNAIVQFRADLLRAFQGMNPARLEKVISAHRERLFDVIDSAR